MAAALRPSIQVLSSPLHVCLCVASLKRLRGSSKEGVGGHPYWLCHTQDFLITQALSVSLEQEAQFAWLCCSALPVTFPTFI